MERRRAVELPDDFTNRPVLVSLLALIETGTVKHLFVYNTDRLSRNQQTWAVIRYKLLAHSVTLHTASGQMKLKNPVDDLMLGILSEISQYDNRIRAERSRLGRFQKVQQGNWKGGPPPFGYRLVNRRLEIDPFESGWVRNLFDWYGSGVAIKTIQSRLSREGVLTRQGNAQWSLGSIQLILRNPGLYRTRRLHGQDGRGDRTDPDTRDPKLFHLAQDRRTDNRKHRDAVRPAKHFYLLRGLLFCGHCGSPMGGPTHKAGHQHVYYCVKKERVWKTRGDQHPKWKRGTDCPMTRSVNIERTDSLGLEDRHVGSRPSSQPIAGTVRKKGIRSIGGRSGQRVSVRGLSDDDRRARCSCFRGRTKTYHRVVGHRDRSDIRREDEQTQCPSLVL
jgi:site-specific DNA recombinase